MAFKKVMDLGTPTAYGLGELKEKKNPNKGKHPSQIEGYLLGFKDIPSKFSKTGFAKLWVFQTAQGNVGIFGKTDLDGKLNGVTLGTMTRATRTGSVPTNKGNDMITFSVEVDEENTVDVGSISQGEDHDDGTSSNDDLDNSQYADEPEESDVDAEEAPVDEVPPPRAQPPRQIAKAPDADRQAKVNALLNRNRTSKSA